MLYDQIIEKVAIDKGWSEDQKYCITTSDYQTALLRISPIARYDSRKLEFSAMQKLTQLGMPICNPLEIGLCHEGCYVIHEWIRGQDLSEVIHLYSQETQYALGIEAGTLLRNIHQLHVGTRQQFDWAARFNHKLDLRIDRYLESPVQYEKGQLLIDYINTHRDLLQDRPIVFQHGDYHIGNMMINEDHQLVIIDFDRSDYGDPWEEFNRIVWCDQSPIFATGMVDGYFEGDIPTAFWPLLALYIVGNSLGAISWALPFGEEQVAMMVHQAQGILASYDDMARMIPKWYQPLSS